jgi:hypothetical protein
MQVPFPFHLSNTIATYLRHPDPFRHPSLSSLISPCLKLPIRHPCAVVHCYHAIRNGLASESNGGVLCKTHCMELDKVVIGIVGG